MCGIFSILNNKHGIDLVKSCFEKGSKRGPENSTLKCLDEGNLVLGFHRLAINGYKNTNSEQPITINDCTLICNGEIYNWKQLHRKLNIKNNTGSDCEIILHLYQKYGIEYTLNILDGVFSFILFDNKNRNIYVSRDQFGVRPLFYTVITHRSLIKTYSFIFASEMKQLIDFATDDSYIKQFNPGSYSKFTIHPFPSSDSLLDAKWICEIDQKPIMTTNYVVNKTIVNDNMSRRLIRKSFENAVLKRITNTDREIGCLLSGGLDSSLVAALVQQFSKKKIHTWSIGLPGSEDLKYAKKTADFLGTIHHHIEVTEKEFIDSIDEVIYTIESYDTTTIRASVGNWLISKYIKNTNDSIKVIFNGDGSDELTGGYMYFHNAPDILECDKECKRLLNHIHYFDVLRSDRSISSHGLEARTPFLDREFVQTYLSIPVSFRHANLHRKDMMEKQLLRHAFWNQDKSKQILPDSILWRPKEAFSDGVSSLKKSWFQIIQNHIKKYFKTMGVEGTEKEIITNLSKNNWNNPPETLEQLYYRMIFEKYYPNQGLSIPYMWMPRWSNSKDSSARTLKIYDKVIHKKLS